MNVLASHYLFFFFFLNNFDGNYERSDLRLFGCCEE